MVEDPINPLLDQLGEILKIIEKNANKPLSGPVDPEIEKQLAALETAVNEFENRAKEGILQEGKTLEGLYEKFERKPESYSEAEKRILRRCRDLGVHACLLKVGLARAIKKSQEGNQRDMSPNTKKTIQKRRNKFKGAGDSKWKRL